MSVFIEKNLEGKLFSKTHLILYIVYKESKKKFNRNFKPTK